MIKSIYKSIVPEGLRVSLRQDLQKLIAPFYFGNRFYCNCCDKSFRAFLPKGNIKREHAACPYCGSLERTRLLYFYLQNEVQAFSRPLKVLHFAPEACLYAMFKKLNIEYVDADINPALAHHVIDITSIPYKDHYFDLIICSHVLGHVPDEEKAIQELKRVLKPNGVALIVTLINPELRVTLEDATVIIPAERLQRYGESDLCRLHGSDFGERLEKQGFSVEKIDYRQALPDTLVQRCRLGNGQRELIFKCTH
ncbi:class I SAM-dependent methyltransferase [uncultured Pontibacter sp.]|uniref:class I SAM-dependent methyltransferase n=1 Tax=uncultured Pontibacter sp. TaxID=453356 RepID=UPI00263922F7|nr:class I SAM-dependent methyltransferase [uncultured Pontibacter sp.]